MKRFIILCCLLSAALNLHARAIQEDANFSEDKSLTSYAFGMIIGSEFSSTGLEINYQAFTEGLKMSMENGRTIMTRDEAIELVENAFQSAAAKRNEEYRVQELLFLTENGERPEVISTDSGLQYEVIEQGEGAKPNLKDRVQVNYEGTLTDGSVFDISDNPESPAEFPLNGVIPGWSEGLQLMSIGSKYRLYIPSRLAYGEMGAGSLIPPYSTLIFTVELLNIIDPTVNMPDVDEPLPHAE